MNILSSSRVQVADCVENINGVGVGIGIGVDSTRMIINGFLSDDSSCPFTGKKTATSSGQESVVPRKITATKSPSMSSAELPSFKQ